MELWHYPLLALAGLAAGFVNVMAAGGSLISMPIMIFLGMPPATANGTNRVALLVQNIVAVDQFRRSGFSDLKRGLTLALCTIPGALLGAVVAIEIDPTWFKRILAGVLVASLVLILGNRKNAGTVPAGATSRPVWAHLGMVVAGFYGGFIQAGVGFILIAVLHRLLALDLVKVTMHKVFIIGIYTIGALAVFALDGQVRWLAGLVLAVGNGLGAWIATRLALTRGETAIRFVFVAATLAMAIKLAID